jgi:Kef-type K+ transport system membrane component KefB
VTSVGAARVRPAPVAAPGPMCWDPRVEFLVLALAGTFVGAALGAARAGAPRRLQVAFLVLAVMAVAVAVVLLASHRS